MSAALADFLRSRELFPTRTATINAAICLRKEGRAEQALELDEDVLRTYPDLEAKDRAFVENEIAQLRPIVGSIDFVAGEPGASIVIDGRERGTFPPPAPIRVASGVHVVRVYKAGFVQLERRIEIAGRQLLQFDAKLSPLLASGRLVVTEASSKVLTVVVDNVEVGKTPFEGTLPVGHHVVALRGPDDLGTAPVDAVIQENQSTPLGLAADDPLPADRQDLRGVSAALDLVYGRKETRWVRALRQAGIRAEDGREMLVQQGAASLERFFPGQSAPIEVMRAAVQRALRD